MKKTLFEMTLAELWQLFPIVIKPHNPVYFVQFLEEKALLNSHLKQQIVRLEHIGSTAIVDLASKPSVDILCEVVADLSPECLVEAMTQAGYIYDLSRLQPQIPMMFKKGYTEQGYAEKVIHLHVRRHGDHDELYFRDLLQADQTVKESYETLKKELEVRYRHDREAYTEAKSAFIKTATAEARKRYGSRYKPAND